MAKSDSSDHEMTTRHRHKKSNKYTMQNKDKKRRHSGSVENSDFERSKKKKRKQKAESENEYSADNKSKTKRYSKKGNEDAWRKNENRINSVLTNFEYEEVRRYKESKSKKSKEDKQSISSKYKEDGSRKDKYEKYSADDKSKNNTNSGKTYLFDTNLSLSGQRSRYNSESESDVDERNHTVDSIKHTKYYKDDYKKSRSKKNRYTTDENKIAGDSHRKMVDEDDDDGVKDNEDSSKYFERVHRKDSYDRKFDRQTKYDDNYLSHNRLDKGSLQSNGDEDNKSSSTGEKPYRYWSSTRGPVRKNSDSYWNKYSDRLKEPIEHMEVGPRYYSSGESLTKEKRINDISKNEPDDDSNKEKEEPEKSVTPQQKKPVDLLTSRTGGAYIPPAKLRMMQESITDKGSAAYQRLAWEALKKSIQGHVNKVNIANIAVIIKAVMKENIVRGRGLLCRALIQAQAASPSFTNVYAAFTAVLNAKFPKIGELLLKRLVVQFRRGFKRNDKTICITAATFIAHLVNQEVAHEIIALEILTLLIETPTDDSVEVAIAFLKECGMKLTEVSSKGILAIFDMLRNILHEGKLEKRVQYMIEVMFQVRKEDFKAHPSLIDELDLVHEEDKIQHMITLEDNHDPEDILNVFKFDPDYEANEAKYKTLVPTSDDESEEEGTSGSGDSENESGEEDDEESQQNSGVIVDKTETNLVALRKTIYLTIQSSLDFEECAHKLLRMELKPGQEIEMAHMFLDCCAEQRTYEKFFGLLSQRFCQINRSYIEPFEETFRDSYATIHRMSNDKLRNVAKLFAHLLYTDAISWDVLSTIRLNEDDTTSSSRIFIKILFLELSEYMGLAKLNQRVKDPSLQTALEGLFPRDNPKHTRFAINFFTSIGLGGLTDELREHLKALPKTSIAVPQLVEGLSSSSSTDSSSDSSDSSDSSSESSSTESSSSDSDDTSRKKKQKGKPSKKRQPAKVLEKSKSAMKRKNSPAKRKRDR